MYAIAPENGSLLVYQHFGLAIRLCVYGLYRKPSHLKWAYFSSINILA
jgi:hypothetical protein